MDALIAIVLLGLPAAGLMAFLTALREGPDAGFEWREAFLWTALAWAAYATAATWLLSLGAGHDLTAARSGHLTRGWVTAVWVLPAVAGALALGRERARLAALPQSTAARWRGASVAQRALVAFAALCLVVTGTIAVVAAPNNWDSLSYHLMRVEQWVRLGGVATYATHVEPQVYHPPGAEILIAQFRLLEGGDRLAAVVQWFAFAGCAIAASLAARRLGGGRLAQAIAAFLVATTPMAIMQASSTQNDLLLAFWLLVAATMTLGAAEGHAVGRVMAASVALGLALLTKGTAYVFVPPLAALLGWVCVSHATPRRALALCGAALVLVIAPSLPHWLNDLDVYGTPVASGSGPNTYRNDNPGPATIVSNLVRNASNHLDVPPGAVNRATASAVREGLALLGIDANDRATTFREEPFRVGPFVPHEDHAGNLALLVLALFTAGALLARSRLRSTPRLAWLALVASQLLLFCAVFVWQNWNARLQLPLFVLIAPLVAVVLAELGRRRLVAAALAAVALSTPLYLFYNYTRPLVGVRSILTTPRERQYFYPRWSFEAPLRAVTGAVREHGYRRLGMIGPGNAWEYPLQRMLPGVNVYGVRVVNRTAKHRPTDSLPPAVACFDCAFAIEDELRRAGYVKQTLVAPAVERLGNFRTEFGTVELWSRGGG